MLKHRMAQNSHPSSDTHGGVNTQIRGVENHTVPAQTPLN